MAPMPPTQDLIFDVLQRRYLMKFLRIARWSIPLLALLLLFSSAAPVFADDPPDPKKLASAIEDATVSLNVMLTLIAGFLVFFMQAGFALVETGFTRAKNVAHTIMMNMMVFCIGAIGYWICGFAFQFGAVNYTYSETAISATQASPTWAFSPITLGAWGDSLSAGLRLSEQWGIIGLSGFFLQ